MQTKIKKRNLKKTRSTNSKSIQRKGTSQRDKINQTLSGSKSEKKIRTLKNDASIRPESANHHNFDYSAVDTKHFCFDPESDPRQDSSDPRKKKKK